MSSLENGKDSNLPATPFPSRRELHGSATSREKQDSNPTGDSHPVRNPGIGTGSGIGTRRRAATGSRSSPSSETTINTSASTARTTAPSLSASSRRAPLPTRAQVKEARNQVSVSADPNLLTHPQQRSKDLPSRTGSRRKTDIRSGQSTTTPPLPTRSDRSSSLSGTPSLIPQRSRPTGTSASVPPLRSRVSRGENPSGNSNSNSNSSGVDPRILSSGSRSAFGSASAAATRTEPGADSPAASLKRASRHSIPTSSGSPTRRQNRFQGDPTVVYQTQGQIDPYTAAQNYPGQNWPERNYIKRRQVDRDHLAQNYYQQRQATLEPSYTELTSLPSSSDPRYFDPDYSSHSHRSNYPDFNYSNSSQSVSYVDDYFDSSNSNFDQVDANSQNYANYTEDFLEDYQPISSTSTEYSPDWDEPENESNALALSQYGGVQEVVRDGDKHRTHKRSRVFVWLVWLLVLCLLVGGTAFAVMNFVGGDSSDASVTDYQGSGDGSVQITIDEGALGSDIAQVLYDNGVIASIAAFNQVCNSNSLCQTIQPGTYQLAYRMSASEALEALLNADNRISDNAIAVNTGQTVEQVRDSFINAGFSETEVDEALADVDALGLPDVADGNLEGWLASGTYQIGSDDTVTSLLSEMIAAQVEILQDAGVAESEWMTVLTKASIVEREVAYGEYMPQVARVIENRLDNVGGETSGRLQMDSTVLYGVGKIGGVPTQADLEDDNPYNTYLYAGLPPTPISVPSQTAIEAVVNPADGDWLYFVTVNLETGETLFASTLSEHQENVELFNQYCTENEDMC